MTKAIASALHDAPEAFVIANAWDAGSAKMLATIGFQALATSSGAHAGVLGRADGQVAREEALAHARAIVEATDLPVSADLEKGFGDAPGDAAETIRRAAAIGLVGASIEDATGDRARPLYDAVHAAERIAAAVEAARAVNFPFVLTARTENYLRGNPDLGPVEIQHSQLWLAVIQALDGALCSDGRPMGEDGATLFGEGNRPWTERGE
jgi:2-methylisocitrate lyase-like PEP mutase family enzyme